MTVKQIIAVFRSLTPFSARHEMRDVDSDDSETVARLGLRASTDSVNAVAKEVSHRVALLEILDDTIRQVSKHEP